MDGRVGQTLDPRGAGSAGAGARGDGLGRRWHRVGLPIPRGGRAAGTTWRRRGPRGIVLLLLILGMAGALPFATPFAATPAAADSTTTFTPVYPGNTCPPPSYVVPAGTYLLRVVAVGGAGQGGQDYNGLTSLDSHSGGRGGHGARVSAVIPVTPGETLYVDVAHNGDGNDSNTGHPNGGYAYDVANGLQSIMNNGNAGGASIVETNASGNPCSFSRGDYLVVAGGGGGGAGAQSGGGGGDGGDAGANADGSGGSGGNGGGSGCGYGRGGGGGTASTAGGGGSGGCFVGGADGVSGSDTYGGIAGGQSSSDGDRGAGGAGGGGWYGGGGGGNGIVGGGGGGAGSSAVGAGAILESIASTTLPPLVSFTPIASPPDSLSTVAAGFNFSCVLTAGQTVACWGDNSAGQATPPSGTFTSLSAGGAVACGIKTDHTVVCWGNSLYNQTKAPPGQFHQVSVGGDFVCGLRVDSTIACWGTGSRYFVQPGLYTALSSGSDYYCALTYDQHPSCIGNTNLVASTTPTGDQFTLISSGLYAPCGIRTDGTSVCWGGSLAPTPVPTGTFSGLSSASDSGNMCWIGTDGTLQCATSAYGTFAPAPPSGGAFSAVSMGYAHACGVPTTGGVVCWGDDSAGETYPTIIAAWPDPHSRVPPAAPRGQPYSFTFGATYESPAATFSLAGGSLPPGLTLSPGGVLAGTPTAAGDYNFTVSAGDGAAPVATLTTHLLVTQAPAITGANRATLVAGSAGSVTVTTTGQPAPALGESGALPSGVTFTDHGDGTASLGGTPATGAGGVYALTLNARNGVSPDASRPFTLTVNEAPSFTSATGAPFGLNTANAFTVAARGYPTPMLRESGALPAGVTFDAATGRLSGTPSGSAGSYTLTFTAHNGVGTDASQTFTLTTVPWVARAPLPDGREYLSTATGTDGTIYAIGGYNAGASPQSAVYALAPGASSWRAVAPLPLGSGDGRAYAAAATGLDGTIYLIGGLDGSRSPQSGVFAYTPATNSWRSVAALPGARVDLAAATDADGTIYAIGGWYGQTGVRNGQKYSNTVFAYTPATNSWSQVASLPDARYGLAAATGADGTIYAIAGANAAYVAQSSVFAYTPATDSWRNVAALPGARVDLAAATDADGTIYALGGADASNSLQSSVYAYTPATDSWASRPILPGDLSGLGAAAGADGAIYAIGGQGDNGAAQATTLAHYPPPIPPTIGSATSATFAVGTPGAFTVTATGRPVPTLSESGALPSGVTFTDHGDGTASLSGTPARGAGGSYPLTFTAHNGGLPDATQRFTLTVTNPLPATGGLSPAVAQAGGGAVALTVSGANFVPGSRVRVTAAGGTSATLTPSTVAPDGTSLTVTIPAAAIATAWTLQVAVVNAAPGGGASNPQPLFVTAASAAVSSTRVSITGTATTGGTGPNTAGSVTVSGSGGSGTVAVAIYAANPGGTPSFAASGGYFDAYVAPGSAYSSVRIVDCALQGGSQAYWYNAATASWVAASSQSYDPSTQCTTVTVTATSTPNLTQLGGTPFGIANVPPVVAVSGPQNALYGRTLSFTVTATDVEPGDGVTLAASGLPAGLNIGPTMFNQATGQWTATVSGTVTALAGTYPVSITANDGVSASAAKTVSVSVKLFAAGGLLALSQDGADCHLLLNGGATVGAAGAAAVDGTSGSALCLNSATLNASTTAVQGGVRNNNSTVHGPLLTHQPAAVDLLATLPAPAAPAAACPGAACPDGTTLNGGHTYRLLPGSYTAAITANSGATVCVAPGVYALKVSWTLNSAAPRPYGSAGCPAAPSGTGDLGVLLYFAQGHVLVNGNGDLSQLRAMVSGPYAGLLYWQADGESTYLNGSGGFAGGAWYEPKGALTLNGSTRLTAPYVAAATITVNGAAALTVTGS